MNTNQSKCKHEYQIIKKTGGLLGIPIWICIYCNKKVLST